MDQFERDADRLWAAKAGIRAAFARKEFSLLRDENDYKIAHNYEHVGWDRLPDSLSEAHKKLAEEELIRHSQLGVAVVVLVALVDPGSSGSFAVPTLSRDALRNAAYRSVYVVSGEVKLVNGKAEVDDPEGKVTVSLTEFVAFGDLNGDGLNDAVAVLGWIPGTQY